MALLLVTWSKTELNLEKQNINHISGNRYSRWHSLFCFSSCWFEQSIAAQSCGGKNCLDLSTICQPLHCGHGSFDQDDHGPFSHGGQACSKQCCVSLSPPTAHVVPPYLNCKNTVDRWNVCLNILYLACMLIVLFRIFSPPPPHPLLHILHSAHWDHLQSTIKQFEGLYDQIVYYAKHNYI